MNLRSAQVEDRATLEETLRADPFWRIYGIEGAAVARVVMEALARGRVWTVDGGYGWLWYIDRGGFDRDGYVRLLAVHPRYQGHGVGRFLMSRLEEEVKGKVGGLFALASVLNPRAVDFYRGLGYGEVGRIPGFVLPGVEEVILWKLLS